MCNVINRVVVHCLLKGTCSVPQGHSNLKRPEAFTKNPYIDTTMNLIAMYIRAHHAGRMQKVGDVDVEIYADNNFYSPRHIVRPIFIDTVAICYTL
jgi:hypothetical protein